MKKEAVEELGIIGGLVGVQFVYAANSVLMSFLMSLGIDPLDLVILTTFSTFLIVSPLAFYFERSKWPKKFSLKLMLQLLLISFGGVTVFQSLFLKGIKLTSPSMGTAMPNLAPGLIFVIACMFRLEKLQLSCVYSKIKILGTILCVVGAISMSIMQSTNNSKDLSPPLSLPLLQSSSHQTAVFDQHKLLGCFYLFTATIVLSSLVVLQAATLGDFPAPMSLCAITSLIGVILCIATQIFQYQKLLLGWSILSIRELVAYSFLGGMVSGACVSFNGWAMKKRGPVLVSMFSPIGTVCSLILSVVTLGESIKIGSVAGMFLMFTGLYFVLWAKGKEGRTQSQSNHNQNGLPSLEYSESEFDAAMPLLS